MSRSTLSRRSTISALAFGAVALAAVSVPASAQQLPSSGAASERPVANSLKPQSGAMTSTQTPSVPTERRGMEGAGAMGATPAASPLRGNLTSSK